MTYDIDKNKIDDIDVNKILVSKKESYCKKHSSKYFIGYNDDDIIRPFCIKLLQMIVYVKHFDSSKAMPFKVIDNKLLKGNGSYKCLLLIMLDSVVRANKKYYPSTLLEECKYEIKKNQMENLINDDLNPSSSDESDSESDNECDSESDSELNDESND